MRLIGSVCILMGIAACEEKTAPPPAAPAPIKALAPEASSEGRGTVKVAVHFAGEAPAMSLQDRSADKWCARIPTREETVLVANDGTLRNVIVRISAGIAKRAESAPPEPVVINQKQCMFRPRVAVALENQKVHILNSDRTLHNVHGYRGEPARSIFNHAQLAGAKAIEKTFLDGGEIISIRCDIHPWMASYIAISTHAFFGITDEGPVTMTDVPAGTKTIETWHEKYGFKRAEVRVRAGQVTEVAIIYRPEDAAEAP